MNFDIRGNRPFRAGCGMCSRSLPNRAGDDGCRNTHEAVVFRAISGSMP
jgi:hypothetical protein